MAHRFLSPALPLVEVPGAESEVGFGDKLGSSGVFQVPPRIPGQKACFPMNFLGPSQPLGSLQEMSAPLSSWGVGDNCDNAATARTRPPVVAHGQGLGCSWLSGHRGPFRSASGNKG